MHGGKTPDTLEMLALAPQPGRWTKVWRGTWMTAATIAAVMLIFTIVRPARTKGLPATHRAHSFQPSDSLAQVTGPHQVYIRADTPLARNLELISVGKKTVSYPLITVTGSVVARVAPGSESLDGRWQFANGEIATAYADWLRTTADIEFNEKQLNTTRELSKAQVDRNEAIVSRLKSLTGSIPVKELMAAEADLVQVRLQGQKDIFAAESLLRASRRDHAALERQLAQAGIEPVALSRARDGMVLVSANVPEAKIGLVKEGQGCEVRFFGLPGVVYSAHVEELGSVLSTERRTLRVLFDLDDPEGRLRPGMFAEIGLGADEREATLIPTNAVVHINRGDYVFRQTPDGQHFDVVEVEVSESPGEFVEVIKGLQPGDRIAGHDAVLLKPLAVRSLAE
ncbi:MAG: efflux RND transporter periplasmic adaptor subunit [Pirellulales bacterium]|nr:efflux RND transporter periplasmic adaptor subunit [Pirellulales bacterium]